MSLPLLAFLVMVVLAVGYRYYGGFIAQQYRLDPAATTPAVAVNDGVDFVPTRPFYLLRQFLTGGRRALLEREQPAPQQSLAT